MVHRPANCLIDLLLPYDFYLIGIVATDRDHLRFPDRLPLFAPLRLPAVGVHGAMMRFGDGSGFEVEGKGLREASHAIETFVAAHPGLLFEDKGASLTVHFRHLPELRAQVLAQLKSWASDEFLVLEGKMVAELKLAHFNKGTAIGTFMGRQPFSSRRPIFIGDDITDEYGFDTINKLDGISIRVGRAEEVTKARYRLSEPAAVRAQLGAIAYSL